MRAVIVANGNLQGDARLQHLWQAADLRIAADGGARNARHQLGLAPQIVVGDLDSLDPQTRSWLGDFLVEFVEHPVAKDETDLELAVNLARERGADAVTILGAFGGRTDQFVANVLLLARTPGVIATDRASEMWVATANTTIEGVPGDTVSLIPLSPKVEGLVTSQLEFALRDETLAFGITRGVSNCMLASRAEVSWSEGVLLVVHLFDSKT